VVKLGKTREEAIEDLGELELILRGRHRRDLRRAIALIKSAGNKQQTTNNKQQTTNNKQQITNNKQQITNNMENKQVLSLIEKKIVLVPSFPLGIDKNYR